MDKVWLRMILTNRKTLADARKAGYADAVIILLTEKLENNEITQEQYDSILGE